MTASAHRLLYAGVAVILLATAYLAGIATSKGGFTNIGAGSYQDGFDAGFADAHGKILASGVVPPTFPLSAIAGTVTAVDGNIITMEVTQTVRDPLVDPAPVTRTVRVSETTAIERSVQKDRDVFRKEQDAYLRATRVNPLAASAPLRYTYEKIALKDIAAGASITVTVDGENVDLTRLEMIENPSKVSVTERQPLPDIGV